MATLKDLQKAYPEYEMIDEDEEDRLESLRMYGLLHVQTCYSLLTSTKHQGKREGSTKEKEDCGGYVQRLRSRTSC
jgi:hypothetical protein